MKSVRAKTRVRIYTVESWNEERAGEECVTLMRSVPAALKTNLSKGSLTNAK